MMAQLGLHLEYHRERLPKILYEFEHQNNYVLQGADNAWVTLATNDSYALGAQVLAHSLKKVNTKHKLVVLVTPGVTDCMKEKLSKVFDLVQNVDVLDSKDAANLALLARPELGVTFTKLHCWTLVQFKKCVFLDADTLVIQNSDDLFDRDEFSAAPDVGWPDCFNSGVFVFKPSVDTFNALLKLATDQGSFDGGDQGLLNTYFSNWSLQDSSKRLPFIYNLCSTACYSYLPAFKQYGQHVRIFHFIGNSKPWLQHFDTVSCQVQTPSSEPHLGVFLQFWWNIFFELVHPTLDQNMGGLAAAYAKMTLGVAPTEAQVALEEKLRKEAWEAGHIDYMGRDSFDNILQKISETLSLGKNSKSSLETSKDNTTLDKPKTEEVKAEAVPSECPKPEPATATASVEPVSVTQPEPTSVPQTPTSPQPTSELGPAVLVEKTPEIGPAVLVKKGKTEKEKTPELGPGVISTVAICPNLTVAEIYNPPLLAAGEQKSDAPKQDAAPADSTKQTAQQPKVETSEVKSGSTTAQTDVQASEIPKTPDVIQATPPATPLSTETTESITGGAKPPGTEKTPDNVCQKSAENLKVVASVLDTPPVNSENKESLDKDKQAEITDSKPQNIEAPVKPDEPKKEPIEAVSAVKSSDPIKVPTDSQKVLEKKDVELPVVSETIPTPENIAKLDICPKSDTDSKPDAAPKTDVCPKPDAGTKTDICPKPDAAPKTDVCSKPDATPKPDVCPKPDVGPNTEVCPKSEAGPKTEISSKPEAGAITDASPKSDASPKTDACPKSDASPKTDVCPQSDASPKTDVCPKPDAGLKSDVCPKLETGPKADTCPKPEAKGETEACAKTDVCSKTEACAKTDVCPKTEACAKSDVCPKTEACPKADICSKTEACPKADVCPKTETCPKTDICPKTEACPKADVCPKTEACPNADVCPKTEACPKTDVCPKTEACPKTEVCPKTETCPKSDACPKTEACPKTDVCPTPEACPKADVCSKPEACSKTDESSKPEASTKPDVCSKADAGTGLTSDQAKAESKPPEIGSLPETCVPLEVCPPQELKSGDANTSVTPNAEETKKSEATDAKKDEEKQSAVEDKNVVKSESPKEAGCQKPAAGAAKKKPAPTKGQGDKKEASGDGAHPSMPVPPPRKKDPKKPAAPKPTKPSKK